MLGRKACQCALEGKSGRMAAIRRIQNEPYRIEITDVPVSEAANAEKKVPMEWMTPAGNDVTEEMIAYLRPLIQGEPEIIYENGIPCHIRLY